VVFVIVMDCSMAMVKKNFNSTKYEFGQFYLNLSELCTIFFLLIPSDILTDIFRCFVTSFTKNVH